jgi:hypothetical protein
MFWLIACFVLVIILFLVAIDRVRLRRRPRQPVGTHLPPRYFGPAPHSPAIPLSPDTVEAFIAWVAEVPVAQAQLIRDQVAQSAADVQVVDALTKALFQLPAKDFGRHLLILSVLGETRNPRLVGPLTRFIWLPGEAITPPLPAQLGDLKGKERDATLLDTGPILQARAVEMLAYLQIPEAIDQTLNVAAEHPSKVVRVAAIDAYLFNHENDGEAFDRVRRAVREEEQIFVGLPHRSRSMDPAMFDAEVRAFYEQYPEQRPPALQPPAAVNVSTPIQRRQSREAPSPRS